MRSHNTPGPGRRSRLVWVLASAAGAAGWLALVAAAPPRFFAVAVPFCLAWAVLSAAAAPADAPRFAPLDVAIGIGSGVVLFAASRAFLFVACGPWSRALCGPLGAMYGRFETRDALAALALGFVLAPAEELFWRGVVQARLASRFGAVRGVAVATLAAAAASLATGEALLALAMLPTYGLWGALFAWRRDLTAPVASHATWSVLVATLFPPGF
ncbi:MAG TPA: CPBP family intramembrane glutamic endopeptidase [Anaeromyxobacteraceae bacterium]|nr:CPBP family intramembrane glutamic endopeptidase [Anaeromyxobacteraceae bacterium]